MRVILTKDDLLTLFGAETVVYLLDIGDGSPGSINRVDNSYYFRRHNQYEPCTTMMNIDDTIDYMSDGVVIELNDYKHILCNMN